VQRIFSLRVCRRAGLPRLPYLARLSILGLESLSVRRSRFDLSFAHAVSHGRHHCPPLSLRACTADYPLRDRLVFSRDCRPVGFRARFAPNRVASAWNAIPFATRRLKASAFKARILNYPCHS
jgi:hypothetical protein